MYYGMVWYGMYGIPLTDDVLMYTIWYTIDRGCIKVWYGTPFTDAVLRYGMVYH